MQTYDNGSESGCRASFWDPKQYMRTVKRSETANKLCSELSCLILERAEIENAYSSHLKKWALRINQLKDTDIEYGTCSNILSGLSKEAEENAELHSRIAGSLNDPVQSAIKYWQKDNFHKSSISNSIKEVKALESNFENAQKGWYKRYKTVQRFKKEYFHACKTLRTQQVQLENAKNTPVGTQEQQAKYNEILRKVEEKVRKAVMEEEKTRDNYKSALNMLSDATPPYIDDMTKVFDQAQNWEKQRIEFFKKQAFEMMDVLNISQNPALPQIYVALKTSLEGIDADADLKQWSFSHGVDMPTCFPAFEEYTPEVNSLNKSRALSANAHTGVTLTGISTIGSPQATTSKSIDSTPSPTHSSSVGQDNNRTHDQLIKKTINLDSVIPIKQMAVTASEPLAPATNCTPKQLSSSFPLLPETPTESSPITILLPSVDSVFMTETAEPTPTSIVSRVPVTPGSQQHSTFDSREANTGEKFVLMEVMENLPSIEPKERNSMHSSPAIDLCSDPTNYEKDVIGGNELLSDEKKSTESSAHKKGDEDGNTEVRDDKMPTELNYCRRNSSSIDSTKNPFA